MEDYIGQIKQRVRLKEGTAAIERVLFDLYFKQPVSTKELARNSLLPIPVVTAMKKEGIKLGILEQRNGVALTERGMEYLEECFGLSGLNKELYHSLLTDKRTAEELAKELAEELADIYEGRPTVDVTIDQAKGTPLTAVRRSLLTLTGQTLLGKSILCVGDDDLVSPAIGFLLKKIYKDTSKAATKIYVLEKDLRYVAYIREVAGQYELPIVCVETDLQNPLPLGITGIFDAFFTDPPYTAEGLSLFLSRGIGGLKKEKGLKIFLSFGQKPNEDVYQMQQIFLSHGLILTGIHDGFNQYEGASLLGSISQMMELETTDHTKAVIPVTFQSREKIYTADKREMGKRYKCRSCKKTFLVGKPGEPYGTIELLKESGCPECGGSVFDQERKQEEKRECAAPGKRALGEHILVDFFGCSPDVLDGVEEIKEAMEEAARRANATIVSKDFHRFSPFGVSGAIIIQESHLTIHTWPEYQYAAVDIFTCGESLDLWKAVDYLGEKLKCTSRETTDMGRGMFKFGGVDASADLEAALKSVKGKDIS